MTAAPLGALVKDTAAALQLTIPAGTTLFHATAKAGDFKPDELFGNAYMAVNFYHPCTVLLEHTKRDSEKPEGTTSSVRKRGRAHNVYEIWEFDTTRALSVRISRSPTPGLWPSPSNVDATVALPDTVEEIHFMRPTLPLWDAMQFVRRYPLRAKVLERASMAIGGDDAVYTDPGDLDDEVTDAILGPYASPDYQPRGRWWNHVSRSFISAYGTMRALHDKNDSHAMALMAITLGLRPTHGFTFVESETRDADGKPLPPRRRAPVALRDAAATEDEAERLAVQEGKRVHSIITIVRIYNKLTVVGYSLDNDASAEVAKHLIKYAALADAANTPATWMLLPLTAINLPGYMMRDPRMVDLVKWFAEQRKERIASPSPWRVTYDMDDILPPARRARQRMETDDDDDTEEKEEKRARLQCYGCGLVGDVQFAERDNHEKYYCRPACQTLASPH